MPLPISRSPARLAILGGGLSGLAAAATAAEHGLAVELFEARRTLGGRAGSFDDPQSGELVDFCQHVSMGCCTNLADFCRRTHIDACFRPVNRLHFFGPDGTQYAFAAASYLPAPLHLMPAFLRLGYLTLADRLHIGRTMLRLARLPAERLDRQTVHEWLAAQGASPQSIERFWSVVLDSALGEKVDRASAAAAQKVFVDGFLAHRRAYEVLIPDQPLRELFDCRVSQWLTQHGVTIHRAVRARTIELVADGRPAIVLADGSRRTFDFVLVTVSWRHIRGLLSPPVAAAIPGLENVDQIDVSPITGVHLWFDRPVMRLDHAVLVGRLSQWVFAPPRPETPPPDSPSTHYYQVVISGSHPWQDAGRAEMVCRVCDDLRSIWPAARDAQLVAWRMVAEPNAVFSVRPGLDRLRPGQETPLANFFLAGDWTATGWPATMEGAVRSGYLAVEAILRRLGTPARVLVPDLPRGLLAWWMLT
jgi:squalene-associated FAD-dependent desaturase